MVKDYDNILVPVDGSETAERAFDKAVKIALDNNAHLDVLNVIDTRQSWGKIARYFDFRRYLFIK